VVGQDTIFALSTAPGKAGLAVIRVSGPRSLQVLSRLSKARVEARKATRTRLRHPETSRHLDDGLFIYFKGPKSFTGNDTVEFHVHGAGPTVSAVLDAIAACNGNDSGEESGKIRPALHGEFARMALESGKLDLTALEGLSALLNASTEAQRRLALSQSGGALKRIFDTWRTALIEVMASLEAIIDFGDDEDIHDYSAGRTKLEELEKQLERFLDDGRRGEILTRGIKMTIFGPPNAGKSSLFNRLVGRNAAIVSSEAGTTRDVIEVTLDIGGFPVVVGDTAGIRSGSGVGVIESQGVELAKERIASADLKILVVDGTDMGEAGDFVDSSTFVLVNKIDKHRLTKDALTGLARSFPQPIEDDRIWPVSLTTNEGYDAFTTAFARLVRRHFEINESRLGEGAIVTQARQRYHINACLDRLKKVRILFDTDAELALVAEELRLAIQSLGQVVGEVDVEDVLDSLFATFCIGK